MSQKKVKIMLSAGEVSGDIHGSELAKSILKINPDAELFGFGGQKMQEAGVRLVANIAEYSVMGIFEVVKNLGKIFRLLSLLKDQLKNERPDILVLIDYPDFNWRLARYAKKIGIKVFSYIPPSAWAWRKSRAQSCAKIADEFACIFPFELEVYQKAGANIFFWGNPLVDTVQKKLSSEQAKKFFNISEDDYVILLLPGSRKHEIQSLLPVMLQAAEKISQAVPNAKFFLPVAQNISQESMQNLAKNFQINLHFTNEYTYDLMALSEFSIAASGTVILECALMNLPSIVLYKLAPLTYYLGKLLIDIPCFSLPNILLNEKFQPELLQDQVTAENIFSEAQKFFQNPTHKQTVQEKLKIVCQKLGEPHASERVAQRILLKASERN